MNDRELLELAAKAAGWNAEKWVGAHTSEEGEECGPYMATRKDNGVLIAWNPLTDDGDALRLAVKLGQSEMIDLYLGQQSVIVDFDNGVKFVQVHNDDSYAATRRAIVRAAAEIGKGMK